MDYAHVLKDLADIHFSAARTIVLIQDNLNIHSKASLHQAFPAAEARRLVERFEWHYTPKHGSWLNLAESELGVLSSQCLDRRIPDKQILVEEVAAWEHDRNAIHAKANWRFTTPDARIKLKRLYPVNPTEPGAGGAAGLGNCRSGNDGAKAFGSGSRQSMPQRGDGELSPGPGHRGHERSVGCDDPRVRHVQ